MFGLSFCCACLSFNVCGAANGGDGHAKDKDATIASSKPTKEAPETGSTAVKKAAAPSIAHVDSTQPSPKKTAESGKEPVDSSKSAKKATDGKKDAADKVTGIASSASAGAKKDGKQTSESHVSIVHIKVRRPAALLVPPPPPDTPTMMPSFGDETSGLMPMEYMSPELLKKRKLDLVAQLADAKSDLKQKQDDVDSLRQKAVQFKTLFEEGVISRRELEAAQKEAGEIDSSVHRAQLRVSELQTLLDGVNGRWNQIKDGDKKKLNGAGVVKKLSAKPHRTH